MIFRFSLSLIFCATHLNGTNPIRNELLMSQVQGRPVKQN